MSLAWSVPTRAARLGLVASMLGLVSLIGAAPVGAAGQITLTTPYPAVAAAPGSTVNFDISITTDTPDRVDLTLTGAPADWTATLRGGGFTVDGVETDGTKTPTKVTLAVTVPQGATEGTQRIVVRGVTTGGSRASDSLPVDVRVTPNAAGDVTLTTDIPSLKGASNASFPFTLTLTNSTSEDLPFSAVATGPAGWTVTAQVGSSAQAASVVVKAGATSPVSVSVKPAADAAAGKYPIGVDVTSGSKSAHQDLEVEITGSYTMTLTTADQRVNMSATAGGVSDMTVVVSNTGTADLASVALSATAPNGWKVAFEPATVAVPAGQQVQAVAHVTPSSDAIAGDYVATFKATAPEVSADTDIRVTIETSLLWGAIGVLLILLVLGGLWWTFRRYGRR
ncbi:MAG: NEW3 domain-containing protein [Chloroflexota bacterium]